MQPIVALFLCIAFIAAVLVRDVKRTSGVSSAAWVPLLWFFIVASRPVSVWLAKEGSAVRAEDVLAGSPIDRAILSALIIAGLVILLKRKIVWPDLVRNNAWIFLWISYCGISILWSDFSGVALKRWVKEIGTLVMVFIILTESDPLEALKALLRRSAYILIPLSILLIKYYRTLGVAYDFWVGGVIYTGVTENKNTLGRLCLVSAFFFVWTFVSNWRTRHTVPGRNELFVTAGFLLMTLWLLRIAHSATSTAAFFIGILTLAAVQMPLIRKNLRHLSAFIILSAATLLVLQYSLNIIEYLVGMMGRSMTLTDRTDLWKELMGMVTNPLIGAGYDSFWLGSRLERLWQKYWWMPNEAHNGYLEVYLNLGLLGLLLLSGVLISAYRKIQKMLLTDFEYGRFKMGILIMLLFYNVTEAAFRGLTVIWFVFLLIALEYPQKSKLPVLSLKVDPETAPAAGVP